MISIIKKYCSNNLLILLMSIFLHYFLTPSESENNSLNLRTQQLFFGFILFLFLYYTDYIKKNRLTLYFPFIAIAIYSTLINFQFKIQILISFLLFVSISLSITLFYKYEDNNQYIYRITTLLLKFWIFSLFIQILIYLIRYEIFDIHSLFHPHSEARIESVGDSRLLIRFTGVHIEPGTYSNWVFGLILIRGIASGKLYDKLSTIGIISTLFTSSAWAFMSSAVFIVIHILRLTNLNNPKSFLKVSVYPLIIYFFIFVFIYAFPTLSEDFIDFVFGRLSIESGTDQSKIVIYENLFKIIDQLIFLGKDFSYEFCSQCESPQDAGVFINLGVRFGFILTMIIFTTIALALKFRFGILSLFLIFPLALAKYYYFDPIFWIIFGLSFALVMEKYSS